MNMWTTNLDAPLYLYVFSSQHMGCKIGVTKTPDLRRKYVQSRKTGRVDIEFLCREGASCFVESTAHAILIDRPHEYEWFIVDAQTAIQAVLTAYELMDRGLFHTPVFRVPGGGKRSLHPHSARRLHEALEILR